MPTRKTTYRRRRIVVVSVAIVVLAALFYLPLTLLAPLHRTVSTEASYTGPITVAPHLTFPSYGDSGIAVEGMTGLLGSGGSTKPMPIASITKIITTLVVLQKKPLAVGKQGPNILFTQTDVALRAMYLARGGDAFPVQVGAELSEHDVIETALIPSANNYARALADWAFGSEAAFVPVAQAWLKSHGMTSTTITDATGLNPQNTSTPTDLIALGKLALANPIIAPIVQTKSATLPVVGLVTNTNLLLGAAGIDGIKTGTLTKADLLFSSLLTLGGSNIRIIGVVLDGPDHPTIDLAIHTLVKQVRAGFHIVTVVTKGQVFATYRTPWGTTTSAIASRTVTAVVWGGTAVTTTFSAAPIGLAARGTSVGSAAFTAGTQHFTVPLVLSKKITDPGAGWRITHPGKLL